MVKLTYDEIKRMGVAPEREEQIHDPRKADLDERGNIIIQGANPGMIKKNQDNDYTVIPIFV